MSKGQLHLIKLCVGAEAVEDLVLWQEARGAERAAAGLDRGPFHVTRMWPRRAEELCGGGSLYWVFKGLALARQRILGFDPREGADGVRRCAIRLDAEVLRTCPQPRRPFQGWRYLRAADAPADLGAGAAKADLPPALMSQLDLMGVL